MENKMFKQCLVGVIRFGFLCIFLFGFCSCAKSEREIIKVTPVEPSNIVFVSERKVIEVWKDTIERHELSKENIDLIENLLAELGADSIVLSKNDQIRMNKSLDRYLQQFGFLYKEIDENSNPGARYYIREKTNPSEGACYGLAWMISRGAREGKLTQERKREIRASYESFTNEETSLLEKRLYSAIDPAAHEKYSPYITKCIEWLKKRYDYYYCELHDDFLYPGFDKPFGEKVKKDSADNARLSMTNVHVPPISKRDKLTKEEKRYVESMRRHAEGVPGILLWGLSWRNIEDELRQTEEWGIMTFSIIDGRGKLWPFGIQFIPEVGVNKSKKLGRWKEK
jgi:hypothetical protein